MACAALALGCAPAMARARQTAPTQTAPDTDQLWAAGNGQVQLQGHFVVFGLLSGRRAAVRVTDFGGDASVTVSGRPVAARGRTPVFSAGGGRLFVTGTNILIDLRGTRLTISASGTGTARFAGSGMYTVNGGSSVNWGAVPTVTLGGQAAATTGARRGYSADLPAGPTP